VSSLSSYKAIDAEDNPPIFWEDMYPDFLMDLARNKTLLEAINNQIIE
jgi:hypothetical protein